MILDFDISAGGNLWTVFDCQSGKTLAEGEAMNREYAVLQAVGFIARRTKTRLFVVRGFKSYSVFHPGHGLWAPLALTPEATDTDAHDMAAGFAWATGRNVEVVDIARF
jgi:hypothetical protein